MYYYSANEYYKKKFGDKVYKVSVSANVTCPNRDGTLDTRGCIFCSQKGSGDFAENSNDDIRTQIDNGIKKVRNKTKSNKFIAYFQSFTNTYARTDYLREIFNEAINDSRIVALSIATRPDCLPNEVLNLLDELNKIKPVFAELGLQTIHERTAKYIRRGYNLSVFDEAVDRLNKIGINIIVHTIIGLPYETKEMMLQTVEYIGKSNVNGIKLQMLHVLQGTDLEKEYNTGKFQTLTLSEYIDIICSCIEILPENIVIHRLTGDGDKKILIAPLWSGNKKLVLNTLNKELKNRNIIQGSKAHLAQLQKK